MEGASGKVDLPNGKISQIVDSSISKVRSEESSYLWKIDNFDQICSPKTTQVEPQGSEGETSRHYGDLLDIDFIQTAIFKRGETVDQRSSWRLYLKKHKEHPGYLGLHLYLEDHSDNWCVDMGFVFSLVDAYGQEVYPKGHKKQFQRMSSDESCGDPTFIKIQDLYSPQKGYLIQQNTFKIHLRMTIIDRVQEFQISEELPMHSIWGNKPEGAQPGNPILSNLWLTKSHADVTIKCEGTEILVHKIIICGASKVFAAMFSHQMTESVTNTIVIEDMDAITVNEMLSFMYTGEVSPSYLESLENGQQLLNAAEKYQMMDLTNFCWAYLCRNFFADDHLAELILLAHFFSSRPEVKTQIYSYANRVWGNLKSREDIKQVMEDYPAAVMPILMLKGDGCY